MIYVAFNRSGDEPDRPFTVLFTYPLAMANHVSARRALSLRLLSSSKKGAVGNLCEQLCVGPLIRYSN
jgi:hypothetical protein